MTIQTSEIPIIDFEGFGDGSGQVRCSPAALTQRAKEIGEQFYAACRDVGFAYLVNTGVPQEEVDAIFSWSRKFFELPYDVKMTAPHPPRGDQHRCVTRRPS
jgi:isopenicillin N synthase-like dioxygenase